MSIPSLKKGFLLGSIFDWFFLDKQKLIEVDINNVFS